MDEATARQRATSRSATPSRCSPRTAPEEFDRRRRSPASGPRTARPGPPSPCSTSPPPSGSSPSQASSTRSSSWPRTGSPSRRSEPTSRRRWPTRRASRSLTGDRDHRGDPGLRSPSSSAFFTTFLLVFAVIALVVGAFVIYNTFGILVAQRGRELALLRAIGAVPPPGPPLGAGRGHVRRRSSARWPASGSASCSPRSCATLLQPVRARHPDRVARGLPGATILVGACPRNRRDRSSPPSPGLPASRIPPVAAMRAVTVDTSGPVEGADRWPAPLITLVGGLLLAQGLFGGGDNALLMVGVGAGSGLRGRHRPGPDRGPAVPAALIGVARGPLPGHDRSPGPGEHVAQPQAHVIRRRRPDDRRRPGRAHHHRGGVGHALDRRGHRRAVHRRLRRRLRAPSASAA